MKYPMFDKNDNAIIYEHEFPVVLKCEKCRRSEKSSVYFSNHIPDVKKSFHYEYGTKKDQKGKFWWTCDCGGSMYISRKHTEKNMKRYNYSYDEDTMELTVYENNRVLATIGDVEEEQADEMFKEVVFELREIKI